jgi:hypothetical protein
MHRHTRSLAAAASLRLLAASVALPSLLACSDAPAPPAEASGQLPQLEWLPLLGGIDGNNDGVRDDIADHIRKTYTDPVQYRAAMQVARALQATLLVDTHDHIALKDVSDAVDRAIACIHRVAFTGESSRLKGSRLLSEMESMTANTKERLQAYLAYNKAMSGSVSGRPEGNVCE